MVVGVTPDSCCTIHLTQSDNRRRQEKILGNTGAGLRHGMDVIFNNYIQSQLWSTRQYGYHRLN